MNSTNEGCWNCSDCNYCINCSECTFCFDCKDCGQCNCCAKLLECFKCNYCFDCTCSSFCGYCYQCKDCSGCIDCSEVIDCSYCTKCSECNSCNKCTGSLYLSKCTECVNCIDESNCIELKDSPENNWFIVPRIDNIHTKIYDSVRNQINRKQPFNCETPYCRAEWAIYFGGIRAKELEQKTSTIFAAMMVYKYSSQVPVNPSYYLLTPEQNFSDIESCSKGEKLSKEYSSRH
jgi:hypothetical protein